MQSQDLFLGKSQEQPKGDPWANQDPIRPLRLSANILPSTAYRWATGQGSFNFVPPAGRTHCVSWCMHSLPMGIPTLIALQTIPAEERGLQQGYVLLVICFILHARSRSQYPQTHKDTSPPALRPLRNILSLHNSIHSASTFTSPFTPPSLVRHPQLV